MGWEGRETVLQNGFPPFPTFRPNLSVYTQYTAYDRLGKRGETFAEGLAAFDAEAGPDAGNAEGFQPVADVGEVGGEELQRPGQRPFREPREPERPVVEHLRFKSVEQEGQRRSPSAATPRAGRPWPRRSS